MWKWPSAWMSPKRCASSWRSGPWAPAHASTSFAYEAKLWKGVDLLRIRGNLVSQTGAVANKTNLVIILQSQGSSSLSYSCHESPKHSGGLQGDTRPSPSSRWEGHTAWQAQIGSLTGLFLLLPPKEGKKGNMMDFEPSLWQELSSGGGKTEEETALCGLAVTKMTSIGSHDTFKLFSSLTHFLLLDVLISYYLYSSTYGQVNRLFWIQQLCWLIALFKTKLEHLLE